MKTHIKPNSTHVAGSLVAALIIVACGGGGGGEVVANQAPSAFTTRTPGDAVSTENGSEVHFLGRTDSGSTPGTRLWGKRSSTGAPASILQSLTPLAGSNNGLRVRYDDDGRPILVLHGSSGVFLTADWNTGGVILKFFNKTGQFAGGAEVRSGGSALAVNALATPAQPAAFRGSLTGLTDSSISFSVGLQNQTSSFMPIFNPDVAADPAGSGKGKLSPATDQLQALATATAKSVTATSGILTKLRSDIGGNRTVQASIIQKALANSSLKTQVEPQVPNLLKGATEIVSIDSLLKSIVSKLQGGTDVEKTGLLKTTGANDPQAGFLTGFDFTVPSPNGDPSWVAGVVASREYGAVYIEGALASSNKLAISGRAADGTQIRLEGTLANNEVQDGAWSVAGAALQPANGSWAAQQAAFGQCQQQQNSGNQGIFTNVYDMGSTCGDILFQYEAYTIPDRFQILYEGQSLYDSGSTSGGQSVPVKFNGKSSQISVVVTAPLNGTAWDYVVGCPSQTPQGCGK